MGNFLFGFLTPLLVTVLILSPSLLSIKPPNPNVSIISQDEAYAMIYTPKASPTPPPVLSPTPSPSSSPSPVPTPEVPKALPVVQVLASQTTPASDAISQIISAINAFRNSNGLSNVSTNNETCAFAKTRASEISSSFNHDGFRNRLDGKSLPYPSFSQVTENIAMTSNPSNVVTMWINSSGHAENMKKDTPFVCVASSGNYYAYEGWKP